MKRVTLTLVATLMHKAPSRRRVIVLAAALSGWATPLRAQSLDGTCTVTVNGQTAQVNPDGTFAVTNVAAPDQFGPGGPGTRPDFLSDDPVRAVGVCNRPGGSVYFTSECFRFRQGESFVIPALTFTDAPIKTVKSIRIFPTALTLTALDQATQINLTAAFSNGTVGVPDASDSCPPIFLTSNPAIVSVNSTGVATAKGPGTALITASVVGAAAVTRVTVSLGDPLTTVVGLVQFEDGELVPDAIVRLVDLGGKALTQTKPLGFFSIAGVASTGPIRAVGTVSIGGQRFDGGSSYASPVPAGFTDVGLVTLNNEVFWVTNASGSWHTGANWSIGDPPSSNHKVTIDVPADITVTHSQGTSSIADLVCREDFLLMGGTLTLNGPLPSFFNGPFTLQGGSLGGAGNLIIGSTMTWKGGTIGGAGTLTAPPGSTVSLATGSLGLSRTFVNQGTINVTDGNPTMNLSGGGTLTNRGTVAVASGRTVTVNNGVLNLEGGTFGGPGSAITLNSATVNLDPDFVTSNGYLSASLSTLNGPGTLINDAGMSTFRGTFNLPVSNQASLDIVGFAAFNGVFSNEAGGTIHAQGVCCESGVLNVPDGFINRGAIELTNNGTGYSGQVVVSNGTLVNEGTITVPSELGPGEATIDASLDNQGIITLNHSATLTKSGTTASHVNQGTIHVTGGNLTIDLSGGDTLTNTGTVAVASGRTVTVNNGVLNLEGGTFGGPGSAITLNSATVNLDPDFVTSNGYLSASLSTLNGPGTLINDAGISTFRGTFNLPVSNQASLDIVGFAAFNGVFSNEAGGTIHAQGVCCESGVLNVPNGFVNQGAIELTNNGTGYSGQVVVSNGTLVNEGTITAPSELGPGEATIDASLDNQGIITLNHSATLRTGTTASHNQGTINVTGGNLTMNSRGGTFTNTGTVAVASGRTVTVNNGVLNLEGGAFGGPGSAITLNSATVNLDPDFATSNGYLSASLSTLNGPGTLINDAGMSTFRGTFNLPVSNQAVLDIVGFAAFNGVFSNEAGGTIHARGLCCESGVLNVPHGFINRGAIELINSDSSYSGHVVVSSGTLVNEGTITAPSGLGSNDTTIDASLDNQGVITLDQPTTLTKSGTAAAHVNQGTIDVTGGNLTIDLSGGDTLTNTGTINLASGRKMTVNSGNFTQASGGRIMLNDATIEWSGTTGSIAGGELTGTGTLLGPVSNSGGTISPGLSAGVLTLSGNYTQGAGGTLAIELGGTNPGTDFDQLPVSGNAVLAGTLRVELINGFTPKVGQQFQIMTAGSIIGTFAELVLTNFPAGLDASVSYAAGGVTVLITGG